MVAEGMSIPHSKVYESQSYICIKIFKMLTF